MERIKPRFREEDRPTHDGGYWIGNPPKEHHEGLRFGFRCHCIECLLVKYAEFDPIEGPPSGVHAEDAVGIYIRSWDQYRESFKS